MRATAEIGLIIIGSMAAIAAIVRFVCGLRRSPPVDAGPYGDLDQALDPLRRLREGGAL